MANYGVSSAFLLVGGNDLSAETWALDENVENVAQEVRGLGETMDRHAGVGIARVTLDAAPGLYSDAAAKQIQAYQSNQNTRKLVSYGFWGDEEGDAAIMMDGYFAAVFKRQAQRDGLTLAGATFNMSGTYYGPASAGLSGAVILGGRTSRTLDGDTESASVDNSSSSASGLVVDLHVPALDLDGGSQVVVTVQDSTDDAVWDTIGTFTAVTAAGASERLEIAGTIERYLSITWAFTGGGGSETVTPYVVAHRN